MLSARTTRPSTSTSTSRASSRTRTPSTTSSTRTRASRRSCAKAGDERVAAALGGGRRRRTLEPAERELIKKLLAFPDEVAEAAERRAPHRIAAYALELAQAFTAFYRDCRGASAPSPTAVESFRLALSVAAQRVIARALGLLGVRRPTRCDDALVERLLALERGAVGLWASGSGSNVRPSGASPAARRAPRGRGSLRRGSSPRRLRSGRRGGRARRR